MRTSFLIGKALSASHVRYWHMVFMSLDRFSSTLAILDAE